jgi:Spy/CpxP family protein refolding chaperone
MEFTERLAERLDLTEEQRTRLETVMEERRRKTEALMESVVPALRSQTDSLQLEIEAILTEEQRAIYRRFAEEGRDRFRGRRRPGQRPPS